MNVIFGAGRGWKKWLPVKLAARKKRLTRINSDATILDM
jgi:hypothetical protein